VIKQARGDVKRPGSALRVNDRDWFQHPAPARRPLFMRRYQPEGPSAGPSLGRCTSFRTHRTGPWRVYRV